jgi:hypothetical protein
VHNKEHKKSIRSNFIQNRTEEQQKKEKEKTAKTAKKFKK